MTPKPLAKQSTLGQFLKESAQRFPEKPAFFFKQENAYRFIRWGEAFKMVSAISSFLLKLDLKAEERVAILSENRPEWALLDLAAQQIGICTVPVYPSLTSAEIQYILNDSQVKLLAVSNKNMLEKILSIQKFLPSLRVVLGFDLTLQLLAKDLSLPLSLWGDALKEPHHPALDEASRKVSAHWLASIIYTSGTTGVPKGAMLTHDNFVQNVLMCKETLKMSHADKHLSFLPLCHVFERTAGHFLMIALGASIAYAENLDTVPENIRQTKPTFLLAVPRFFEKTQARVLAAIQQSGPLKQKLFYWALELGRKRRCRETRSVLDVVGSFLAALLVYNKVRARLGGRLRFCVSGGAPLPKDIAEFFCDLGIMIYEGYGLTETSPVISVNRQDRVRFGSVGIPLEGVKINIAADGEVLTQSACVMQGYLNKPEETEAVIQEGWFHTGDLGHLDADGFLFITGRKKELIVTSGGKKISPRPIEELLETDPAILRCVLFGDKKKYLTALLVPRLEALTEHAHQQKLAFNTTADLLKNKSIYDFLDQRIQTLMKDFASYEKIKYFVLLERDFTLSSGELTPTLKIKRNEVISRHLPALEALYVHD